MSPEIIKANDSVIGTLGNFSASIGKAKSKSGCSAIREGCPPIKPDTRIEDFEPFVRWLEGYITPT